MSEICVVQYIFITLIKLRFMCELTRDVLQYAHFNKHSVFNLSKEICVASKKQESISDEVLKY